MSIIDEIDNIPETTLSSDLPDKITAILGAITKGTKQGQYGGSSLLKLRLVLDDGTTFTSSYRIPKALTGHGQLDKLLEQLKSVGHDLKTAVGLKFEWQKMELDGSVKGNPRFYPTKQIRGK